MKLIFVRHAQGQHNADALLHGDIAYFDPANTDAPVTTLGQAQITAAPLTDACDVIYCSPSLRCRQTLLGILPEAAGRPVRLDDRLMESQGSALCNKRLLSLDSREAVPALWDLSGLGEINPFDTWGEEQCSPAFGTRIQNFTADLIARCSEQTVLIVGHHDWIRQWFMLYTGLDLSIKNCGVLRYDYGAKKLM